MKTMLKMVARTLTLVGICALAFALQASSAQAIEIESTGLELEKLDGTPEREAGSHPDVRFRIDLPPSRHTA